MESKWLNHFYYEIFRICVTVYRCKSDLKEWFQQPKFSSYPSLRLIALDSATSKKSVVNFLVCQNYRHLFDWVKTGHITGWNRTEYITHYETGLISLHSLPPLKNAKWSKIVHYSLQIRFLESCSYSHETKVWWLSTSHTCALPLHHNPEHSSETPRAESYLQATV